jgi:diamine N-acetyltransferase
MKIRKISENDVENYLKFYNKAWLDTYEIPDYNLAKGVFDRYLNKNSFESRVEKLKTKIQNNEYRNAYLMIENDELVGSLYFSQNDENVGQINHLYIDKQYIGQGLGRKLIEFAIEKLVLLGANRIIVEVFTKNLNAIKFYKKFGFERNGVDFDWEIEPNQVVDIITLELLI